MKASWIFWKQFIAVLRFSTCPRDTNILYMIKIVIYKKSNNCRTSTYILKFIRQNVCEAFWSISGVMSYGAHRKCLERSFPPWVLISDASMKWKWFSTVFQVPFLAGRTSTFFYIKLWNTLFSAAVAKGGEGGLTSPPILKSSLGLKTATVAGVTPITAQECTVSGTPFYSYFISYFNRQLFCGI